MGEKGRERKRDEGSKEMRERRKKANEKRVVEKTRDDKSKNESGRVQNIEMNRK